MKAEADSAPSLLGDFKLSVTNFSGDAGLIISPGASSRMAAGMGLDVINYKNGLVTLRAEAFFPTGGGEGTSGVRGRRRPGESLATGELYPNASWVAKTINPSVGLFGGFDFLSGRIAFGPMLSVINIPF